MQLKIEIQKMVADSFSSKVSFEFFGYNRLRSGLPAVLAFIFVSPEPQPNKITDHEDHYQSPMKLCLPEPLVIAYKKMKIYSSVSIAANPS